MCVILYFIAILFKAQSELLELSGNVFLACGMVNMLHTNTTRPTWGLLDDPHLVLFADYFLSHNVKLLSVFVHIVEEREPEIRDKVLIHMYLHQL